MTDARLSRDPGPAGPDHLQRPLADGIIPERMVTATERRWFWIVTSVVVVIVGVIILTAALDNLHPPSNAQTIDPARVYQMPEFAESNLGTARNPDGSVTVRFIAQQYSFVPRCLKVPQGTPVTFRTTSADVIHGLIVAGTNVNTMVVPGYIAQVGTQFDKPGSYPMPCHEFCGIGHAGMAAVVQVVPQNEFPALSGTERLRCAAE